MTAKSSLVGVRVPVVALKQIDHANHLGPLRLHGERFKVLAESSLGELARHNRLTIFYMPIFLDETLSSYGSARGAKEWQDHLRLIRRTRREMPVSTQGQFKG